VLEVSVVVDPAREARPFTDQRFVRNLGAVLALDRIVVHYDKPSLSQLLSDWPVQAEVLSRHQPSGRL